MIARPTPLLLALSLAWATGASAQGLTRSDEIGGPGDVPGEDIGRYVFAGVAIDSFQTAHWKTLANAVNDLRGVREVLTEHYGFESPDGWVLVNSEASKDAIEELLDELGDATTGIRPSDALVFFYAGHGTERVDTTVAGGVVRQGFLVPNDVTKPLSEARRQYLEIRDVVQALSLLPARHVLLILDSCQSGLALTANDGLKEDAGAFQVNQVIEGWAQNPSRIVLTSAASNQPAQDGGGPLEGHSLFTGYLMEGLVRAAEGGIPDTLPTERGRLVTQRLFEYVQDRVASAPVRQTPTFGSFMARGGDPGQLVFAFDVDPFADAYVEAMEAVQGRNYESFKEAAERALDVFERDRGDANGPRAEYLRYRLASIPGARDIAAQVTALRRLKRFVDQGTSQDAIMPLGSLELEDLLFTTEELCANPKNNCPAAGT